VKANKTNIDQWFGSTVLLLAMFMIWSAATAEPSLPDDPNTAPVEQILSMDQHAAWGELNYYSSHDFSTIRNELHKIKVQNDKSFNRTFGQRINHQIKCQSIAFLSIKEKLPERYLHPPMHSNPEYPPLDFIV
jgi:hypothetical protein